MSRPSQPRNERGRRQQFDQNDYMDQLRAQAEEQKRRKEQELVADQKETLAHYQNYAIGGDGEQDYVRDLNNLIRNKEHLLEEKARQLGQEQPMAGDFKGFNPSQGISVPGGEVPEHFKPQRPLWDGLPTGLTDENKNTNNSVFGSGVPSIGIPSSAEAERERRLKLRDQERQRRFAGQSESAFTPASQAVPAYGTGGSGSEPPPPKQMPTSSSSRRDQMWEQKRLAKLGGHMIASPSGEQGIQLPVRSMRPPSHEEVRRSMQQEKFNEARNLDQSLNQEQWAAQNQGSKAARLQSARLVDQEVAKSQVYHQELGQMPALGGLPLATPGQRQIPQQPQAQQPQSYGSGIVPVDKVDSSKEEKLRKQREYREMLDKQKYTADTRPLPSAQSQRAAAADQVFQEILTQEKMRQSNQKFYQQPVPQGLPPASAASAASSVPSSHHQQQKLLLQQKQEQNSFVLANQASDEKKQRKAQLQKEYAESLQQQMAEKRNQQQDQQFQRRRGTQSHPARPMEDMLQQQQPQQQQQLPSQFNQGMPSQFTPQMEQVPSQFTPSNPLPTQFSHQMPQFTTQPIQPSYQMGEMQPPISQPEAFQPSVAALRQIKPEVPYGYTPSIPQQFPQDPLPPQSHERNSSKVQEYRQALEQQIRDKQDSKQQAIEKLQNAMEQPHAPVQQQQPAQQNFVRQRTDIGRNEDQKQTEEAQMKKMRFQQELQLQIEEKKRQKEEEQAKKKAEEAREEEKLRKERENMFNKDVNDLKQEGNANLDEVMKQANKKQAQRNSQFEPSQDNPMNHNKPSQVPQQIPQQVPIQQEPLQLPTDQKQEPAFKPRQAYHQEPSGFQGFGSEGGFSAPNPVQVPQQIEPQFQPPVLETQFSQPNPPVQQFNQMPPPQQNFQSQPQLNQNFIPEQRSVFSQPTETQNVQDKQQQAMMQAYQDAIKDLIQTKIQIQEENIKMREKILLDKENEFRLQQQKVESQNEVRNLQEVYDYLHQVIGASQKNGPEKVQITPNIQQGLDELIQRGKSGIQDLERSQVFMKDVYKQQQEQQQIQQLPQNPMNQTPYASQAQYQYHQQQVQNQVQQQVQEQARAHEQKPDPFEQSLSSETKLVMVKNTLAQQEQQKQEDLMNTWKPNEQQVKELNQTPSSNNQHHLLQASLAGTSKLVTGFQQTPAKPLDMQDQSRPATNTHVEPIKEQPENEDAGDFLRESSLDQQQQDQHQEQNTLGTGINPLGHTSTIEDGMKMIERINNGTKTSFYHTNNGGFQHQQSGKATQSDFFNATASKMHEQTSQHVFADQITRLMGKTGTNMNVVAEESKDLGQQEDSYFQEPVVANPIEQARNNEMMMRQQQQIQQNNQFYQGNPNLDTLNEEQKRLLMTNEINIAASLTKTQAQAMPIVSEETQQTHQSPVQYQQNPVQRQTWNSRKTTPQQQNMNISEHKQYGFQEDKPTVYQPEEIKFVDNRMQTAQAKNHEESDEGDVWNDPEVVPVVNDQDDEDEIEGTQQYPATEQIMNQGNIGESHIDGSIDKLKAFSPPSEEKFFIGQAEDEQEHRQVELDVGSKLGDFSKINDSQTQEEDVYEKLAPLTDEQKLKMAEERQQNPHKFSTFGIPAAEEDQVVDEAPEESKTNTKKQQEMMEIAQLIAKATEKTNNLFDQQQKAQASGQNFRPASRKERPNPAETEFVEEDPVLKGLDNLIGNLESQRMQQPEEQARQSRFDATGASHRSGLPPKSARKQRPTSGRSNKSVEGKYSAIAREASRHSSRGTPLGKFAQMGSSKIKEDDFQQVSQKFNASPMLNKNLEDPLDKDGQQRKSILRPVSGKSHSQRYQQEQRDEQ